MKPIGRVGALAASIAIAGACLFSGAETNAQPFRRPPPITPPAPAADPTAAAPSLPPAPSTLRARVGLGAATALMRSSDPDERLRGIERLAETHSPESLALLIRVADSLGAANLDPRLPAEGTARADPRALLAAVRALARWTDDETARAALAAIVSAPVPAFATHAGAQPLDRDPADEDARGAARVLLARREAAIALASSDSARTLDALVAIARSGGPGQGPALDALAAWPPSFPGAFAGVVLTTPAMIALATQIGDLRTLDAILGLVRSSDPALRAAAIAALGAFGDTRGLEVARAALGDDEPRVRIAAADALAQLGAADAAKAIEALVKDDRTAAGGLRLAEIVADDGVAKAAAARAAASADVTLRLAAVAALGRQSSPLAVTALVALSSDPTLEAAVAGALARSPSAAAMSAIEAMAAAATSRRVAARAYFARAYARGERQEKLDTLLTTMAESLDPRDRAVAMEAQVALGETSVKAGLADADPRVRRAAAMGAMARATDETNDLLVARIANEPDEATRIALSAGLASGDPTAILPLSTLVERAESGGADAPMAALALGRRAAETPSEVLDRLVGSRDPLLRAHVARGLGASEAPGAVGRLARAYLWEANVDVRRAIVAALAGATATSDERRATLELAASLDPDAVVRDGARRGVAGDRAVGPSQVREVAWIKLTPGEMATTPANETAAFVRSDGVAQPIAFDEDGYALVAGVPPGDGRVRLAPRLPSYSPPGP